MFKRNEILEAFVKENQKKVQHKIDSEKVYATNRCKTHYQSISYV